MADDPRPDAPDDDLDGLADGLDVPDDSEGVDQTPTDPEGR